VVLHAGFPQFLGGTMVGQLKANGGFVLLEFTRSDLDVEMVALVGDLQNLGPGKAVDAQSSWIVV